jgi:hypothetical protein
METVDGEGLSASKVKFMRTAGCMQRKVRLSEKLNSTNHQIYMKLQK